MQFDSVKDALDHLCSYAGQDGDEAAVYITGEIARRMDLMLSLKDKIESRDRIIADLRERVNELTGGAP